jgi:nucleoside-diphosphate-sugar epimerase
MRVFVTGGTGFTGSRLVPLLLEEGYQVRCLYRPTSDRSTLLSAHSGIEWAEGDLSRTQSLASAMHGSDVLVNIASLGSGHADSVLHAAQTVGIERAIFISTTAIFTRLNAKSRKVRVAAELSIEMSGLQYTILRPTMIYGSPRDRNMWRLIRFLRYSPVIPVFGDGTSLQQPIHVDDVARAVVRCLSSGKTICRSYNIAGKQALTYNEVIDTIARLLRKQVWKWHIPSAPVVAVLALFERLRIPLPIRAEQIQRLNENKSFSYAEAERDFGFRPLSFEEGVRLEIGANKQSRSFNPRHHAQ